MTRGLEKKSQRSNGKRNVLKKERFVITSDCIRNMTIYF